MLVLSRNRNESIVINGDIEVMVVDIRGDKVRLGITAPKKVPIHRREVHEAIQRSLKTKPSSVSKPESPSLNAESGADSSSSSS